MAKTTDSVSGFNTDFSKQVLEIGARLENSPSQLLIETAFQRELDDQLALFDALCRVDLAHTLVMIENGIVPLQDGRELLTALRRLQNRPADFQPDANYGDLYTNREVWLNAHTSAGIWLGAGRARREAITTAYVIKLREELISLVETLTRYVQTLSARAEHYETALMPDYTYLQAAQPTSFGHYLLGFAYPVLRDIERIQGLYRRINQSPAGCGSSNGSRLPQSRKRLSQLLGFDGLIAHARDAMWQADLQIEITAVLTTILINLDRLAEDLQIFATEEFALVEFDDRHARASKIMPQKKNPFALTYIRGLANTMTGTLAGSAALGRTPSGQPDNRLTLYGMIPKALADTQNAVALMSEVVALMKFNCQHARAKLDHGFALATDLAEVLVLESGLSFREAHRLVGRLVRNHLATESFQRLTPEEIADCAATLLDKRVELKATALSDALNPEVAVASRYEPGGAAAAAIAEMISECHQTLHEANLWCRQQQLVLKNAEAMLEQSLHEYLTPIPVR
ncbi:MAG: 2-phosphosulfolactate phosphatase XcbC [Methylobacter sp.]